MNTTKIKDAANKLQEQLLLERNDKGVWDGQLSSSALAVAVSVFALHKYNSENNKKLIDEGLNWLKLNINNDGGFGDTPISKSNISTSLLCWSAFSIVANKPDFSNCISKLEGYLKKQIGSIEPKAISNAILEHYAKDKTFSVPILAMCALAGRLGENGWKLVPQLPYQFAVLPHNFFRFLNLNVVSYALPALISMGLVKQKMNPSRNPVLKLLNKWIEPKLLKVLEQKQPNNGGFLEAIPLTAFVLMTLIDSGYKNNIVCQKAVRFLQASVHTNGSSPIDTNLTTWVTTLAVNAMSNEAFEALESESKNKISNWLLNQQHKTIHPFTKTAPGGWAWIDTPGGVSDGDDTSGALIAIKRLIGNTTQGKAAAKLGLGWLMGIQNNDGGFPTFCKGWGKLPFDASCPDITAHAIRAILEWKDELDSAFEQKLQKALNKAISYLKNTQNNDGSWLPLWFGNEHDVQHSNPVYGTSLVVSGLCFARTKKVALLDEMIQKGTSFLINCKNSNGSWGGNKGLQPSIEETSLAIKALTLNKQMNEIESSIDWLINKVNNNELNASPIGLYFASLWYYEEMYPKVFALGAINAVQEKSN